MTASLVDCTQPAMAIAAMCGSFAFISAFVPSFLTSMVTIAPPYTGVLTSVLRLSSVAGGVLGPFLIAQVRRGGSFGVSMQIRWCARARRASGVSSSPSWPSRCSSPASSSWSGAVSTRKSGPCPRFVDRATRERSTESLQSSLRASAVTSEVAIDKMVVSGGLNPRFAAR